MNIPNPYSSPQTEQKQALPNPNSLSRIRWMAGLIFATALVGGVLTTVIGIKNSFASIAKADHVKAHELADAISKWVTIGAFIVLLAIVAAVVWLWTALKLRKIGRAPSIKNAG
ncbi:MAG: MotA/TolQ/ExbB proton channel family protein [Pirellulaceae bacterium]|nr:MotA/TolQ/ExbB proton channel family protein [Pirellulaceae bacterium]